MKACSLPQSSVHWPRKVPVCSARNHMSRRKPGIASCLAPKAGIHQAWITSAAVMITRTFLPTGTTISLSTSSR